MSQNFTYIFGQALDFRGEVAEIFFDIGEDYE